MSDHFSEAESGSRYVQQIRAWIKDCDELHGEICVPGTIEQRIPEEVPRWLIDTHQQCIVSGLMAHRYIALSYAWPETRDSFHASLPVPRTLLLNSNFVEQFTSPGFLGGTDILRRIPVVIQHAMHLTPALGERYLWVDRLCIVQDDHEPGGTLSQVAKMDKIYAGAYLTIIAAASDKIYDKGIPRDWPSFHTTMKRYITIESINAGCPELNEVEVGKGDIVKAMCARYDTLSRTKWASRGWTYQEQILCKRAVILTDTGLFWDCQRCVWDGVDLVPGLDFGEITLRADKGLRLTTRWWPDFDFYLDLICPYNGRVFSFPQDAMLGILGILNALEPSFPGGFIHGLPRLFLDQALLWQPFGTVDCRRDRDKADGKRSSLPSWSWVGWQGYIDPQSLRSGIWYLSREECQSRAESWRTTHLVKWDLCHDDQSSEQILEPLMLKHYFENDLLPDGWLRLAPNSRGSTGHSSNTDALYYHSRDSKTYFRQPIPLREPISKSKIVTTATYLTGWTTSASLYPATVLCKKSTTEWVHWAVSKISVFEDKLFSRGPPDERQSPILVLQQPNGAFGGLLRLMTNEDINKKAPLELIAISTGTAEARDLQSAFEWSIFEKGENWYALDSGAKCVHYQPQWVTEKGKAALIYDVSMAFSKEAAKPGTPGWGREKNIALIEERTKKQVADTIARKPELDATEAFYMNNWFELRQSFLQWQAKNYPVAGDLLCEFYNVLWIARIDGIAYRRACGWVPKYIWEAHAKEPAEVKLG